MDILDGRRYIIPASDEGTAEIIGQYSKKDDAAFLQFMCKLGKLIDRFTDAVFTTPQCSPIGMLEVFMRCPLEDVG